MPFLDNGASCWHFPFPPLQSVGILFRASRQVSFDRDRLLTLIKLRVQAIFNFKLAFCVGNCTLKDFTCGGGLGNKYRIWICLHLPQKLLIVTVMSSQKYIGSQISH